MTRYASGLQQVFPFFLFQVFTEKVMGKWELPGSIPLQH